MTTEIQRLLTLEETAEILGGISVVQTRRMVSAGEIPSVRIGRLVRIREQDLGDYINALPLAPIAA